MVRTKQLSEAQYVVQESLTKTTMCYFFERGQCSKGDRCTHAHTSDQLNRRPDLKKTSLCKAFAQGNCFKDNCQYAHGPKELQGTMTFFKTKMCRAAMKCKLGNHCRYAHSLSDMRPLKPDNLKVNQHKTEFGEGNPMKTRDNTELAANSTWDGESNDSADKSVSSSTFTGGCFTAGHEEKHSLDGHHGVHDAIVHKKNSNLSFPGRGKYSSFKAAERGHGRVRTSSAQYGVDQENHHASADGERASEVLRSYSGLSLNENSFQPTSASVDRDSCSKQSSSTQLTSSLAGIQGISEHHNQVESHLKSCGEKVTEAVKWIATGAEKKEKERNMTKHVLATLPTPTRAADGFRGSVTAARKQSSSARELLSPSLIPKSTSPDDSDAWWPSTGDLRQVEAQSSYFTLNPWSLDQAGAREDNQSAGWNMWSADNKDFMHSLDGLRSV